MTKPSHDIVFDSTVILRILSFLMTSPAQEFLASEIQRETRASRAGTYLALQQLVQRGFARRTERGRFHLYSVPLDNPILKQFKVLKNLLLLEPLLDKLRGVSLKVILFGSAGRGEDTSTSDFDIFILAHEVEIIQTLVSSFKGRRRIQAIILRPVEFSEFREKEKLFHSEIDRGIVLWEAPG